MTTTASQFSFDQVRHVLGGLLGSDLHAKRVDCLSGATLGVLHSASLAVAAIGHGLPAAKGVATKHAIKQVDRLLSNPGIKVNKILALWVPFVIGAAPPSRWRWTGPTSTPTTKLPSCCR